MKKIIAIFLLSSFLCANTSIGQLFKIPNLIEHYIEHQYEAEDTSISILDFLKIHYSKSSEKNHDDHQNLPFKTIDHLMSVFTFCNDVYQIQLVNFVTSFKKKFFYQSRFQSKLISVIWLPPKIA